MFAFLARNVVAVATVGEVEATIGAEEGAVEAGGVEHVPAREEDFAMIGYAVAIGIVEAKEVRGACDEETALMPQHAHGQRQTFGENRALVVDAVTVVIDEPKDLAFGVRDHFLARFVLSGGFRDKHATLLVEGHEHGVGGKGRVGDFFDREAFRNDEIAGGCLGVCGCRKDYTG